MIAARAHATSAGARVLTGGTRKGALWQPTVLASVRSDLRVCCEEVFGPVAVLIRARDAADAIRLANPMTLAQWSRLARLRVLASATPQVSFSALVQANSLADLATANLRFRYNLREGHDLWLVYGHLTNLDRDRMTPAAPGTARAAVLVKYTRSFGAGSSD